MPGRCCPVVVLARTVLAWWWLPGWLSCTARRVRADVHTTCLGHLRQPGIPPSLQRACVCRQEFDECLKLIDQVLVDTENLCEYAIYVKALIKRQRGACAGRAGCAGVVDGLSQGWVLQPQ